MHPSAMQPPSEIGLWQTAWVPDKPAFQMVVLLVIVHLVLPLPGLHPSRHV